MNVNVTLFTQFLFLKFKALEYSQPNGTRPVHNEPKHCHASPAGLYPRLGITALEPLMTHTKSTIVDMSTARSFINEQVASLSPPCDC